MDNSNRLINISLHNFRPVDLLNLAVHHKINMGSFVNLIINQYRATNTPEVQAKNNEELEIFLKNEIKKIDEIIAKDYYFRLLKFEEYALFKDNIQYEKWLAEIYFYLAAYENQKRLEALFALKQMHEHLLREQELLWKFIFSTHLLDLKIIYLDVIIQKLDVLLQKCDNEINNDVEAFKNKYHQIADSIPETNEVVIREKNELKKVIVQTNSKNIQTSSEKMIEKFDILKKEQPNRAAEYKIYGNEVKNDSKGINSKVKDRQHLKNDIDRLSKLNTKAKEISQEAHKFIDNGQLPLPEIQDKLNDILIQTNVSITYIAETHIHITAQTLHELSSKDDMKDLFDDLSQNDLLPPIPIINVAQQPPLVAQISLSEMQLNNNLNNTSNNQNTAQQAEGDISVNEQDDLIKKFKA